MPRTKAIASADGGTTEPFTVAEEAAADAEEAAVEAAKPARDMAELRTERNTKLSETDWTQSPDSPLTAEAKAEWAVHRQSLRDLPANTPDPTNPSWPDEPQ
jgi:hypothetical protein